MTEAAPKLRRIAAETVSLPPDSTPGGARGAVLTAALRHFAERGFAGASIRDIAGELGLKPASIYSHYPSKEQMLADLLTIGHEAHNRQLRAAVLASDPDPRAQIRAFVQAHVRMHTDYPMLAIVANTELHSLSSATAGPVLAIRGRSEEMLQDIVARGCALGVFSVPHQWLAVAAIGGMGLRVAHWYTPAFELDADGVAAAYAEYALRILGANP